MASMIDILKQIMMIKTDDDSRVGLSQFSTTTTSPINANPANTSIRTKNVKLSDLMRRTNML